MIRYEVETIHKSFAGCEDTMKEAKEYIQSLIDAGVEIIDVQYYDHAQRIEDIKAGRV